MGMVNNPVIAAAAAVLCYCCVAVRRPGSSGADVTRNGFEGSLYAFRYAIVACIVGAAGFATPLHAQTPAMNDLRGKIFDAKMAQQLFAGGLPHCGELNGTNFYFAQRDRVLNLEDYHRSLDSLALSQAFNPETKRPWSQQDADARWAEVQKQAAHRPGQLRAGREPARPAKKAAGIAAGGCVAKRPGAE